MIDFARRLTPFLLSALLVALTANCRHPAAAAAGRQVFQVRGVLKEVQDEGRTAVIKHEEIHGYMAAMTMPFDVRDPRELAGVVPGDTLAFRLTVTATDGWIDDIRVVQRGRPADPKPKLEGVRIGRVVDELAVGDRIPNYQFTNQLGRLVGFNQFRGQAVGITFIYTRCPYPTFCPRQSQNFALVAKRLAALHGGPTNWHLCSISFDPEHDTPSVLLDYARRYDVDPARWSFLTGPIIDIDAITEQFGMFFARDGDGFSHNVRTVVVGADGRIQQILPGNKWTVEELFDALVKAAVVR